MSYIMVPQHGQKITLNKDLSLNVPERPIIPFIEGDGIGTDITPAMRYVVNAAIMKAYGNNRSIAWMEIWAGEKARTVYGINESLPEETLYALQHYVVGIKGPLATPIGGGLRSLNVGLRQHLDLYVCLRPVRYFPGVPSPVKQPERIDIVIFRENSEDIYTGIEWAADSPEAQQLIHFLQKNMGVTSIRFPDHCGIGIKPVSKEGSQRLVRRAIQYAIDHNRPSVTLVHKGNIMKFTEGAFRDWGFQIAREQFSAQPLTGKSWLIIKNPITKQDILIKEVITDACFQQILLHPEEFSVIATLNLNGDYLSDALAAQVGGIGIAPGANLGDKVALFEATHGTAPNYAGQNKANPSSLILSAEMMLRYIGWHEAADFILIGLSQAFQDGEVTEDLACQMPGARTLSCSNFAKVVTERFK